MSYKRYAMIQKPSEKQTLDLPFTGICSFGKYPICTDLDRLAEFNPDIAVLGLPIDLGTQWRTGARMGPRGLRDASTLYSLGKGGAYDFERDEMYFTSNVRIVDCGDIDVIHGDLTQSLENAEAAVRKIVAIGAIPIIFGGDHSVTAACIYGVEDLGPINLIHVDAHLDYVNNKSGQRWGQGSPMRRADETGFVSKIWHVGIRGLGSSSRQDFIDAQNHCNVIVSPKDLRKIGIEKFLKQLPEGERYYISFDIDGMDISLAQGTGTPAPGGLYYDEVNDLFEGLVERGEVVGYDLVEVAPCFDYNQATCLLGARITLNLIGYILKKKEKQGKLKTQLEQK